MTIALISLIIDCIKNNKEQKNGANFLLFAFLSFLPQHQFILCLFLRFNHVKNKLYIYYFKIKNTFKNNLFDTAHRGLCFSYVPSCNQWKQRNLGHTLRTIKKATLHYVALFIRMTVCCLLDSSWCTHVNHALRDEMGSPGISPCKSQGLLITRIEAARILYIFSFLLGSK
jgi:hypothetical protein